MVIMTILLVEYSETRETCRVSGQGFAGLYPTLNPAAIRFLIEVLSGLYKVPRALEGCFRVLFWFIGLRGLGCRVYGFI